LDTLTVLIASTVVMMSLCSILLSYSKNKRKYNWEKNELTDYFIVDTLLKALQNLLDEQSITELRLNRCRPKKPSTLMQNQEETFTECNSFLEGLQSDTIKNKRITDFSSI
jgi:hypothetical protein